jgi:2-dehydropantoate 2-reductase
MDSKQAPLHIGVLGAGAIGAFVGARIAQADSIADVRVTLVGRRSLANAVAAAGGAITTVADGATKTTAVATPPTAAATTRPSDVDASGASSGQLIVASDAAAIADADVVIVAVKSTATSAAVAQLRAAVESSPRTRRLTVCSFQNGVCNARTIAQGLDGIACGARVVACMVGFNVVWEQGSATFRRATDGELALGSLGAAPPLPRFVAALRAASFDVRERSSAALDNVLYAKLIINLFNAVNALAGLPVAATLADRGYRLVWAAAAEEALRVYALRGIRPARLRAPAWLLPRILRLPDPLYRMVAARLATVDPEAKSSMLQDLERGRAETEIGSLCGEIVRLAAAAPPSGGAVSADVAAPATPVNAALLALIREAEARNRRNGEASVLVPLSAAELVRRTLETPEARAAAARGGGANAYPWWLALVGSVAAAVALHTFFNSDLTR